MILFLESGHTEREREGGGSGIEKNLPLAWTSLTVAYPMICMQRRTKRDPNVSWSASQRRLTKRTVAHRPAVSIRLSRSLGFPICPFLASPLSRPHERRPMASRMQQLSSLFFVAWTTQPLYQNLVMGFRRAKFTQRNTNRQKKFLLTIDSGVTTRGPWVWTLSSVWSQWENGDLLTFRQLLEIKMF